MQKVKNLIKDNEDTNEMDSYILELMMTLVSGLDLFITVSLLIITLHCTGCTL